MARSILQYTMRIFFASLGLAIFVSTISSQSMFDKINDFDGDGKADFAVTRNEGGSKIWYVWQSNGVYRREHLGISSDRTSPGDFDGDGMTDLSVSRQANLATATTYYLSSQSGTIKGRTVSAVFCFYVNPQDYDGDGKADPACTFSEGNTPLVYHSSVTNMVTGTNMPTPFFVSVGDLTGDGRAEATVFATDGPELLKLWIKNLATDQLTSLNWGVRQDEFIAGDFDGDDKGDITIFRGSSGDWWSLRSSDNVVTVVHWGTQGDLPVPADYDGDSKTDHAIFRPGAQSYYYINASQTGFHVFPWGTTGDFLVRYGDLNWANVGRQ